MAFQNFLQIYLGVTECMLITKDLNGFMYRNEENRTHNSRFAKAGASCFYDSEVLNSSFVHLMKFSAKNPRLRKAAKRV
jgi:hypothetical protein